MQVNQYVAKRLVEGQFGRNGKSGVYVVSRIDGENIFIVGWEEKGDRAFRKEDLIPYGLYQEAYGEVLCESENGCVLCEAGWQDYVNKGLMPQEKPV